MVTQSVEDTCLWCSFKRNEWHLLGGNVHMFTIGFLITIDHELVLLKCSNHGMSVWWFASESLHLEVGLLSSIYGVWHWQFKLWMNDVFWLWIISDFCRVCVEKRMRYKGRKEMFYTGKENERANTWWSVRQICTSCSANSIRSPGGCQKRSTFALTWQQGYTASPKLHLLPRIIFMCSSVWACFWL